MYIWGKGSFFSAISLPISNSSKASRRGPHFPCCILLQTLFPLLFLPFLPWEKRQLEALIFLAGRKEEGEEEEKEEAKNGGFFSSSI